MKRRRQELPHRRTGGRRQREAQEDGVNGEFRRNRYRKSIPVVYTGILPDLFKEGKGVVAGKTRE